MEDEINIRAGVVDCRCVPNIALDDLGGVGNGVTRATREVVENADIVVVDQRVDEVTADESGTAGYEYRMSGWTESSHWSVM